MVGAVSDDLVRQHAARHIGADQQLPLSRSEYGSNRVAAIQTSQVRQRQLLVTIDAALQRDDIVPCTGTQRDVRRHSNCVADCAANDAFKARLTSRDCEDTVEV